MKTINISQVDVFFADSSYSIEFLLFYQKRLHVNKIRKALKLISSTFWPVFGEYSDGQIKHNRYSEADYFGQSESQADFDSEDSPDNIFQMLRDVNPLTESKLFFLQVIQYRNGTLLLPKMKHLAGDGYSYFYLLSVLAALSQDSFIPFKKSLIKLGYRPYLNRTVLKPFLFKDARIIKQKTNEMYNIAFERLRKEQIRKQIKKIASETDRIVSANDLLSAMTLQKFYTKQNDNFRKQFKLTMPIDVRKQINDYGAKFFGNSLLFHETNFDRSELADVNPAKIALKIRESMPVISREMYVAYLESIEQIIRNGQTEKLVAYNPENGCLVTNLSRLPTNRLNFGSGNPDVIMPITIGKNSMTVLADKENFILRLVY